MAQRHQMTFKVNEEKITIVSTSKSIVGNHNGYMVRIKSSTDPKWLKPFEQYYCGLTAKEAEDYVYAMWVQKYRQGVEMLNNIVIEWELDVDEFCGYDSDGVEYRAEVKEVDGEKVPDLDTVYETGLTMMDYD